MATIDHLSVCSLLLLLLLFSSLLLLFLLFVLCLLLLCLVFPIASFRAVSSDNFKKRYRLGALALSPWLCGRLYRITAFTVAAFTVSDIVMGPLH